MVIDELIRRQVLLERLKAGEVNQFTVYLKRIEVAIREQLSAQEITEFNRGRFDKLLKHIDQLIKAIFQEYREDLTPRLEDLAELEADTEIKALKKQANKELEFNKPDLSRLKASFKARPLSVEGYASGALLEPFIDDWSVKQRNQFTGTIRRGYFEGKTTQQIISDVVGKDKHSASQRCQRDAATIVRTSIQHVASTARNKVWEDNSDILSGYVIVATLDNRTTAICRSMDGQVFKVSQGPLPPLHHNCRSSTRAELKPEFSLLSHGRTRASKDGPVSGDLTYYEWLKTQSPAQQSEAIGPTRAKLLRDGGLSAKRFAELNLDRNFKPLTLEQMRQKQPLIFERAGL